MYGGYRCAADENRNWMFLAVHSYHRSEWQVPAELYNPALPSWRPYIRCSDSYW